MYTDITLQVATAQNVTATAVSTDSVNLGAVRDMGSGGGLLGWVTVDDVGTPGAGTLQIQVITASDAALTTGIIVVGSTPSLPDEDWVLGMAPTFVEINPDVGSAYGGAQQFIGIRFVAGVAMPAGYDFNAGFVLTPSDGLRFYPRNASITFPV